MSELERTGVDFSGTDLAALIDAVKTRSRTITHLAEQIAVRVDASRIERDEKATKLVQKMGEEFSTNLRLATDVLEQTQAQDWRAEQLVHQLRTIAESHGLKLGAVMQPIRVALTGSTVSEPVDQLLAVVGRNESLTRMQRAAEG